MNCQHFETIITDIARDKIMDADTRKDGLAHSAQCARCRARLSDETALSAGFDALLADAATAEASPRVEAALLSAFRERARTAQVPPAAASATSRRWSPWALVTAASVLLMLGLGVPRLLNTHPVEQDTANVESPDTKTPVPGIIKTETPVTIAVKKAGTETSVRMPGRPRRPARGTVLEKGSGETKMAAVAEQREIMTSFMPLTHAANVAGMGGGQLVRVEMPRSALASFGLPVNLERADERVKADVLVGDDGMARAIRFVR